MSLPPISMWLHVASPGHRTYRLWLPLFLLWLLLLPLLVLAVVGTALADAFLLVAGRRYHHYTLLLVCCLEILGDTSGMVVRVRDGQSVVDLMIR
jgi:hypothetical protein